MCGEGRSIGRRVLDAMGSVTSQADGIAGSAGELSASMDESSAAAAEIMAKHFGVERVLIESIIGSRLVQISIGTGDGVSSTFSGDGFRSWRSRVI